ncbi:MAG: hypothetical protein JWP87_674 [Labilithrix sp.]|nr:hypothetical protein [Labilithrix sp.]
MTAAPPARHDSPMRPVVLALVAAVAVVMATASCGGGTPKPVGINDTPASTKALVPPAAQAVIGHMLGSIADRTIGPFLARVSNQAGVVAWVTPAEGSARRVVAVPITAVGEPRGPAKTIANVGVDTTMLVVRPTRGAVPGAAIAWTVLTDRGEALWVVVVGDDGVPRSKPIELARTSDDVVWVDVVATEVGAVVVWAEETRGGEANVVAASLDVDGKVRGVPARIARGVAGWHALALPNGVGISTIVTAKGAKGGALSFQRLDADGHPGGPPVAVVSAPVVSGDVEVVRSPGRLVFAWTDRTTDDPSVAAAALGDDGKLEPPHKVVEARGGAALLGLASGAAGTAMMWEAPTGRAVENRRLYSARIGPSLGIEGRPSSIEIIGRAAPELAATDAGFAILASLRDCETGSPRCPDAGIVPTLIRTDAHLVPVQREPFGFGTDPASMAWGMTCERDICVALAASGASPARVRAAEVRSRVNLRAPADPTAVGKDGPKVTDVTAIATGESVVDIAATRIGDVTMLATLAVKADAPGAKARAATEDARSAPMVLSVRVIDAVGNVSPPAVITTRALAVGGVAIAPAEKPEDGAAVAWVARDNGDPEVHVTKIDKKGKKGNDLQLTTMKGDASDVAIAWAGGGWVVAWIDGRDGNGEVYATRVGTDLSRGNGVRITNAPGDASDLVAIARGDRVWLAWADPRESPKDGMADVFVAAVRTKDAQRDVDEQRLLATAAHSRTPQLAPAADGGVHVSWIEEAPLGVESPASSGYGAMWATVAANGKIATKPVKLPLGGEGAATSVALEGHATGLRAVVARSMTDAIALDGIDLSASDPRAFPLLTLDGPPSLDVALVLEGGSLYFNDDGPATADKRARRARIAWPR